MDQASDLAGISRKGLIPASFCDENRNNTYILSVPDGRFVQWNLNLVD